MVSAMSRSYFHDFTRDDGSPVTVEFEHGDYVMIVDVMPNTPEYEALCKEMNDLQFARYGAVRHQALIDPDMRERLEELDKLMEAAKTSCELTPEENDRMCDWLAEHHVVDYSDDIEF